MINKLIPDTLSQIFSKKEMTDVKQEEVLTESWSRVTIYFYRGIEIARSYEVDGAVKVSFIKCIGIKKRPGWPPLFCRVPHAEDPLDKFIDAYVAPVYKSTLSKFCHKGYKCIEAVRKWRYAKEWNMDNLLSTFVEVKRYIDEELTDDPKRFNFFKRMMIWHKGDIAKLTTEDMAKRLRVSFLKKNAKLDRVFECKAENPYYDLKLTLAGPLPDGRVCYAAEFYDKNALYGGRYIYFIKTFRECQESVYKITASQRHALKVLTDSYARKKEKTDEKDHTSADAPSSDSNS